MSLSGEDENYMRLCMLIDICRRAVKVHFDREFHPRRLTQVIKKEVKPYNTLYKLYKKKVISDTQWKKLHGVNLNSSDFDIPLMICLLKNLTTMDDISNVLPHSSRKETTDDITRIKFYRNFLAHANRMLFSDTEFLEIWGNCCEAIKRMSDSLYEECESLHNKGLDLLNQDINLQITKAFNELTDLKEVRERLRKKLELPKEYRSNPIPPNIRVKFKRQIKRWRKDDNCFVITEGSKAVLSLVQTQTCVAVTGSFGMGKTAIIRHVALQMCEEGYTVVPVIYPEEVEKYNHPVKKNLFIVDKFCGKCDLDEEELEAWNNCSVDFDEKCKLLVSCRLQVYKAIRHDTLNNITFHECNLLSNDISLSVNERQSIARKFDINIPDIIDYIEFYSCFPHLCEYYTMSNMINAGDFFKHPFEVFETHFEMLQTLDANGKVCALMILLMFYDHVPKAMITGDINWDVRYVIANTSKACKIDTEDACMTIQKELENLIDTYVVIKEGVYHALNERIFNFLLRYFGHQMTEPLVKYSCCSFIKERFQLSNPSTNANDYALFEYVGEKQEGIKLRSCRTWDKVGPNAIILSSIEYRKLYVNRMLTDLSKGYVNDVFGSPNSFHKFFFESLNYIDGIELRQLLKKTDIITCATPLIKYCATTEYTDSSNFCDIYLQFLIRNGCPINASNDKGETAMYYASFKGNSRMMEVLINHNANSNVCTQEGFSPLHIACLKGNIRIANLLLTSGANCNTITTTGDTPLLAACYYGHTSIVTELLKRDADLSKTNEDGYTPLKVARMKENHDIVQEIIRHSYTK